MLDLNEILNKENIFYTGLAVFGVIFLSRFFQLYVDYSDLTSNLYVFLSRLVAVLAFALYTKQLVKKDISIFNIFLSLFYIIVIIINILNGGNLRTILSVTYPIIVLSMIMEICFKHNYKSTIISLNYIFIILIFINFFQMVFFNNLLGEYQYFLGGRNHLGIILLISTFITHLYSSIRKDSCILKLC